MITRWKEPSLSPRRTRCNRGALVSEDAGVRFLLLVFELDLRILDFEGLLCGFLFALLLLSFEHYKIVGVCNGCLSWEGLVFGMRLGMRVIRDLRYEMELCVW